MWCGRPFWGCRGEAEVCSVLTGDFFSRLPSPPPSRKRGKREITASYFPREILLVMTAIRDWDRRPKPSSGCETFRQVGPRRTAPKVICLAPSGSCLTEPVRPAGVNPTSLPLPAAKVFWEKGGRPTWFVKLAWPAAPEGLLLRCRLRSDLDVAWATPAALACRAPCIRPPGCAGHQNQPFPQAVAIQICRP